MAHQSRGRMVAWLAWRWRDIAAAEDAVAQAFTTALARWPTDGVPQSPEAWLLTAARRHLTMEARHRKIADDPAVTRVLERSDEVVSAARIPDERLRLMFVCAHPAIEAPVRSALMLQVVQGLPVARIARSYLLPPDTLQKRLTRAKSKIRDARIRFEAPEPDEIGERLDAVLEAIYGIYTLAWNVEVDDGNAAVQAPPDQPAHAPSNDEELVGEAQYLAELVAGQVPDNAEARGLAALLNFDAARERARIDNEGRFVPLDRQRVDLWDERLLARADAHLAAAARLGTTGAFQLEAAIQGAHVSRRVTGHTPWGDIVYLYERLLVIAPTVGARIGHAVATARYLDDASGGLELLDAIDAGLVAAHQPWWVARAAMLLQAGQTSPALRALEHALQLTHAPALRQHLQREIDQASRAKRDDDRQD
jgi:RNA polymerase sigma-70 factor (ECF subfamily)